MMATADILSAYFAALRVNGAVHDNAGPALICEHHEDWVVVDGEQAELVSAKHRERRVNGISTARALLDEGGVLHLFDRWNALKQTPRCRLVTSAALAGEASSVANACQALREDPESNQEVVARALEVVAAAIVTIRATRGHEGVLDDDQEIRRFLAMLTLQHTRPTREDLPDLAPQRFAFPIADRLGTPNAARAVWEAVLGLVRARMRAAGPVRGGGLPEVLGVGHDGPLASRTITLVDVDVAVQVAVPNAAGYAPLPRAVKANKMAVKMARGGCTDNSIERADALRLQFRRYVRTLRGTPGTVSRRQDIENALHRVIDQATYEVDTATQSWGADLWQELALRADGLQEEAGLQGMSADLLLGGISELTNNCRAWFSPRFDAGRELQRMLEEGSAQ